MSEQLRIYADKFPKKLRLAVDGLSGKNEAGFAVMMLLIEEKSLSFTKISERLDLHPQTLSNTLDELQKGGLIRKEVGERIGDQSTGEYIITTFGERLLDSIYQAGKSDRDFSITEVWKIANKAAETAEAKLRHRESAGHPLDEKEKMQEINEPVELIGITDEGALRIATKQKIVTSSSDDILSELYSDRMSVENTDAPEPPTQPVESGGSTETPEALDGITQEAAVKSSRQSNA